MTAKLSTVDKAKFGILAIIVVFALTVFALSIATFVEVNKGNSDEKGSISTTKEAPSATTNSPIPDEDKEKDKDKKRDDTDKNKDNGLHIELPKMISNDTEKYDAYNFIVTDLLKLGNFTYEPCNNFYEYVCDQTDETTVTFENLEKENLKVFLTALERNDEKPYAKRIREAYRFCVNAAKDSEKYPRSDEGIRDLFEFNSLVIKLEFPSFNTTDFYVRPTPRNFGKLLGQISTYYDVNTFINYKIDTTWPHPYNEPKRRQPVYKLFIDQAKTFYPQAYYKEDWENKKKSYAEKIKWLVVESARILDKTYEEDVLDKDIDDVIEFERHIALTVNSDEEKRDYSTLYNLQTESRYNDLIFYFKDYLEALSRNVNQNVKNLITSGYDFVLMEPKAFRRLDDFVRKSNPRILLNYLNYRLLLELEDYFPNVKVDANDNDIKNGCVEHVVTWMPDIASRLFVDEISNPDKRKESAKNAATIAERVSNAVIAQIEAIEWLSLESKKAATDKIKYMTINIGYPEWIEDDKKLDEKYMELNTPISTFQEQASLRRVFVKQREFNKLLMREKDRDSIPYPTYSTSPSYNVKDNSIFIPYGLLQRPFYDDHFSASANYGALGVVIAGQMFEALNSNGQRFDYLGTLRTWINEEGKEKYQEMRKCVADQSNKFCSENKEIVIEQAGEELLAKYAALHAAYNAFENHRDGHGDEPRLPDERLQHLNHQQVFFAYYARSQCKFSIKSQQTYVVHGALQNFPSFKADFNCPSGSKYAPKREERCDVWTSKLRPTKSLPSFPPFAPSVKIASKPRKSSQQFKQIAEKLSAHLDIGYKPCNDFYKYSCGNGEVIDPGKEARKRVQDAVIGRLRRDDLKAPLDKAKALFDACKSTKSDGPTQIRKIFDDFANIIGTPFPLANNITRVKVSREQLGKALFYLSTYHGINPFFKLDVQPSTAKRFVGKPYVLTMAPADRIFKIEFYETYDKESQPLLSDLGGILFEKLGYVYQNEEDFYDSSDLIQLMEVEKSWYQNSLNKNGRIEQQRETTVKDLQYSSYASEAGLMYHLEDYNEYLKKIGFAKSELISLKSTIVIQDDDGLRKVMQHIKQPQIINYLYLRLLIQYQYLIPSKRWKMSEKLRGILNNPWKDSIDNGATDNEKSAVCSEVIEELLPLVYTRAAIDEIYSNINDLRTAQREVGQIFEALKQSFESFLIQLSWAPLQDRGKLIHKARKVSATFGVADWILDDEKLKQAYEGLKTDDLKTTTDWYLAINNFKKGLRQKQLKLDESGEQQEVHEEICHREITANFEKNVIQIPLSYLTDPIYHKENPRAWTWAFLAFEMGKGIGRLFGRLGIEFDANGQLGYWIQKSTMDLLRSKIYNVNSFHSIGYTRNMIEENVVSTHTGLLLASEALKSWDNFYGWDQNLPDDFMELFTTQQLFYFIYGQRYCGELQEPSGHVGNEQYLERSLENVGAFSDAFNCPRNNEYGKKDRVHLWDSEVRNPNEVEPDVPSINIPDAIPTSDSKGYDECANHYNSIVNTSYWACQDLYNYTCGNFKGDDHFTRIRTQQMDNLMFSIRTADGYDYHSIKQHYNFYQSCRAFEKNPGATGEVVKEVIDQFMEYTGLPFPLKDGKDVSEYPSSNAIGKAMGFMFAKFGEASIISLQVNSNFIDPKKGYALTLLPGNYLFRDQLPFNSTDEEAVQVAIERLTRYLNATVDELKKFEEAIKKTAKNIVKLEAVLIAREEFNKNLTDCYRDNHQHYLFKDLPSEFDFKALIEGILIDFPDTLSAYVADDKDYYVKDFIKLQSTAKNVQEIIKEKLVPPEDLINYLFFRLLSSRNGAFLPKSQAFSSIQNVFEELRSEPKIMGMSVLSEKQLILGDKEPVFQRCAEFSIGYFELTSNILFPERNAPKDRKDIQRIYRDVADIIDSIIASFKRRLDMAEWISKENKNIILGKLDKLTKKLMYDSKTVKELDEHYKGLTVVKAVSFEKNIYSVSVFNQRKTIEKLTKPTFDRNDFGPAHAVNAWYDPAANSLTVPYGILQGPIYDVSWPRWHKIGAIGTLIGGLLNHVLDDIGSQFNADGALVDWMDESTNSGLLRLSECVINQYNNFCKGGKCLNGESSSRQNLADLIGIQTAYKDYKDFEYLNGPDAHLPDPLLKDLSNEHLLFMSFVQVFCGDQDEDMEKSSHSPGRYRILGAIQNFPAFRSAFKCPLQTRYTSEKVCRY